MSKNDWLDLLNKETRENAQFAYLWCMSKVRIECGVNIYSACTQAEALAVASSEFQKATKKRQATQRANTNKRNYNSIMKDMGLTRCVGSVSGKVYWE